jgi:hypothetical protein
MVLSKFESAKSSTMKSQSRIRTKLQAKSTIRAEILDKSAIHCINKIKSDDPKSYSPPPPPPPPQMRFKKLQRTPNVLRRKIEFAKMAYIGGKKTHAIFDRVL